MDLYALLIQTAEKIVPLTSEEIAYIRCYFKERKVKKNEILLDAGSICDRVFFVANGLLRTFHLKPNGSEFTRLFVTEGHFCTVLESFSDHKLSPASIQALEDSLLLEISEKDFKVLIKKSATFQSIYLKILEKFQNFQIKRIEFLTQCNAQDKIQLFHEQNQQLASRLNKKIIASYLEISPETYSRGLK